MRRAIVVGATSGIGRELAKILARDGYEVGVAGRREELLLELRAELPGTSHHRRIDVARPDEAVALFDELADEMGGVDLVVVASGTGRMNRELDWEPERETIAVNVAGFAAIAGAAFRRFRRAGSGHLVGISSIAALVGGRGAPAYNASKAFVSNYLEGLRQRAARERLRVTVTDVLPGFVDTAMAQGPGRFWVASPEKAARQIRDAIVREADVAYVTRRWRLVAWLLRVLPRFARNRL